MYTHIIWDFNGTLADDVGVGIDSVNVLLKRRGLPLINSRDEYRGKFTFPVIDYYKSLGFDFERESFNNLADEWVSLYKSKIPEMNLFPGVRETLAEITSRNPEIDNIIISSSELTMMEHQLRNFGIRDYFTEVRGLDNVLAGGKINLVKQWSAANPAAVPLFIGDTTHDFEVSRAAENSCCILFTQGHGSASSLKSCNVPLINSIPESLSYIFPD